MLRLRDVLSQLKVRYQIDMLFEDRLVTDQLVNPGAIDPSATLDKNLTNVLKPQGLRYTKVKTGVYVVLAATETPLETNPLNKLSPKERQTVVDQTISGRVTDGANGSGLPGVSVVVKGTSRGATTDGEGNYRVNAPDQAGVVTLTFSFIGYVSQEIAVGNRSTLNVALVADDKTLSEVVVVGYGTQNRRELTGAIASISTQTIRDQPVTNVVEGLTGRLPGVLIQQNTGAPGNAPSIKVRGLGSISAGNGPLIVVDGQPLNSGGLTNAGGLQQLNPNDIDKIDVLKDASATAIFGSRGANGVVLVTTKRGRSGQPRISVDYYTGVQEVSKKMDLLTSQQFAEYGKQATNTAYLERVAGASADDPNSKRQAEQRYRYPRGEFPGIDFDNPATLQNIDYQALIFQRAPISNYQVSASGGSEKVQYFVSGNYITQNGIIKQSGLDRYTVRSNIDAQLSSKLKVGLNFSPSYTLEKRVNSDGPWAGSGVVNAALSLLPFLSVYQANGVSYNSAAQIAASYNYSGVTNPLANITERDDRVDLFRLLGNAYAEYAIWKTLRYRGTIGADLNYQRRNRFQTSAIPFAQSLPPNANNGSAFSSQNVNWVASHTLNYTLDLNTKHHIEALVGLESQKNNYEEDQVSAINFPHNQRGYRYERLVAARTVVVGIVFCAGNLRTQRPVFIQCLHPAGWVEPFRQQQTIWHVPIGIGRLAHHRGAVYERHSGDFGTETAGQLRVIGQQRFPG